MQNLLRKMNRMVRWEPLFVDITWGAGGSTTDTTLELCRNTQQILCVNTQMHLTCTNMAEDKLHQAMKQFQQIGMDNVLTLRGDKPSNISNNSGDSEPYLFSKSRRFGILDTKTLWTSNRNLCSWLSRRTPRK